MNLPRPVPAVLSFPEEAARQDSWGRLLALAGTEAGLETRARLEKGEKVFLSFELPGDSFPGLPARVFDVGKDRDGYVRARVEFLDEVHKKKLARAISRLLATR